jgi:hypothetical protein
MEKVTKKKSVKVYSFEWIDENGKPAGWNDVSTTSGIVEARKLAKAKESKPRDFKYQVRHEDGSIGDRIGRFEGLFVNWASFKRISIEQHFEDHRLADIRSR